MTVKGRSLPGSPLICTADKSKSVGTQARAGLAREGLENELLKSRHPSQAEEPNPPPRRHKRAPRCFTHRGLPVSRRRWTQSISRADAYDRFRFFPKKQTDYANSGKSIFRHAKDAIELKFSPLGRQRRVGVGRRGEE